MMREGVPDVSSLDRIALVVHQPLPYVYLARQVLHSAHIPCQMFDALPLASEPYAAALDLLITSVTGSFSRVQLVARRGAAATRTPATRASCFRRMRIFMSG